MANWLQFLLYRPNLRHQGASIQQEVIRNLSISRFLSLHGNTKAQILLNLGYRTHNWVNAVIKCTQLLFSWITSCVFTICFTITHRKGCIVLWPSLPFYLASGCTVEQRRKQTQLRINSLARQDPAAKKLPPLHIAADRLSPRLNDIQIPRVSTPANQPFLAD